MAGAFGPLEIPGHRLERLLGSGGFADVFLYTQEMLGRPVAVKIMREQVEQGALRSQFTTEANLMAQLATHPSIVTIFSADVSDTGRPYIMMEYCSKPSLAERYKARPLSVAEMLQTMIRLCGAVETAHRAGILHRDIKPANVLTTDYGWPALTDFGISAIVGEGTIGGGGMSVPWSPPEAFTGAFSLDARSDVYSLAATAYTVLVGHSPFDDAAHTLDMGAFVYRILESPVPPMQRSDVPDTLQRLLAVAMAKDPDERPPSAASFARALQRIEHDLMLPATQLDVPDALVDDLERTQTRLREIDDATTLGAGVGVVAGVVDGTVSVPLAAVPVESVHPLPPVEPPQPEIDEATVVVSRPVLDEVNETGGLDEATVIVERRGHEFDELDDHTVVIDDRTVIVDDRTVIVGQPDDRTVVVDRLDAEATSIVVRPERGSITHHTDVPLRSSRIAYVPDPDEISRYRARKAGGLSEPVRVDIAPPPQRVAPASGPKGGVIRERRRGLAVLLIGLSVATVAIVAAIIVLSAALGGAV